MFYLTIKEFTSDEFIEKKSRFIGYATPVANELQALEFIKKISKKHYDATHNVYAYILRQNQTKRYSDDGEPQGTAGIPVLDVLQKEGLTDVCVVVTRYFGGIMLGAGGLVRAYSHGASIAIKSAQILNMQLCVKVELNCDYSIYGKIIYLLENKNVKQINCDFNEDVKINFIARKDDYKPLQNEIIDFSNGQILPGVVDELYFNI